MFFFLHVFIKKGWLFKGKFSMFSHEKGYKIRVKIHGKGGGGIFYTSRLVYAPLLDSQGVTPHINQQGASGRKK